MIPLKMIPLENSNKYTQFFQSNQFPTFF